MASLTTFLLCSTGCSEAPIADANWAPGENPLLRLGAAEGEGPQVFGRLAGAAKLDNGTIVVADQLTLQVSFFTEAGELISSSGGSGEGPGEFRTIMSVRNCGGDTVFVYDPASARLGVYDSDGLFVGTRSIPPAEYGGAPPYEFYCSREGMLAFVHRSPEPPARVGPRRPQVAITLWNSDLAEATALGQYPASERYFDGSNDFPRPLGKETSLAVGNRGVYIGSGDYSDENSNDFSIPMITFEGHRTDAVQDSTARWRIRRRDVRAYLSDRFDRGGRGSREAFRRQLEQIEYPETFPAYGRILLSAEGDLWVEKFPRNGGGKRRWHVYSPDGSRVGVIDLPPHYRLLQVDTDQLLGITRDEMGVEFVELYELDRAVEDRASGRR